MVRATVRLDDGRNVRSMLWRYWCAGINRYEGENAKNFIAMRNTAKDGVVNIPKCPCGVYAPVWLYFARLAKTRLH